MTEHGTILTDLIMRRNDFIQCSPAIQKGIRLYAEATDLISRGLINEGRKREQEAFDALRESGSEKLTSRLSSQVDELFDGDDPYIPRNLLEMD